MTLLLAFALTLVAAVLVSERASRTILSTSVVFLGVGVVLGATMLPVRGDDERVHTLVELALVVVLFTEGISLAIARPAREWRLPARALALGMPFTVIATALLAHGVASLPWHAAWLVGAALAPTDPVFASALVGREGVPHRVRHLLNVESGINDGLALPLVAALLAASGERGDTAATALGRAVGGAVTGAAVAWLVVRLEALRAFGA
jgi:NhaP-type Na+/H+ or K+/H+ antiporter